MTCFFQELEKKVKHNKPNRVIYVFFVKTTLWYFLQLHCCIVQNKFFLAWDQIRWNEPILSTRVTNKNTGFAIYCPWAIIVFIGINTLVIIEILMLWLVKGCNISHYNHLTQGDYSRSAKGQNCCLAFASVIEEAMKAIKRKIWSF